MAKLEGVKIIDAKDGKITKIQYEGNTYVNVGDNRFDFKVGDIALNKENAMDADAGNFYEVEENGWFGFTTIYDDADESHSDILFHADIFRKSEPLSEGDYVVALPEADKHYAITDTKMRLGKVVPEHIDSFSEKKILVEVVKHDEQPEEEGRSYVVNPEYFRKATEEEIKAAKCSGDKFSVGDYAKVIGGTLFGDISEGTYVKISDGFDSDGEYRIELLDGTDHDYAKPESLEKVGLTDADLSFLKIGRKPGEIKDGDIVRTFKEECGHPVGTIGEAYGNGTRESTMVKYNGETWLHEVKLIAPVESRVDADA